MKKKSFDKETLVKICKGALIAFTGAGTLAVLDYIGTLELDNPMATAFIAWIVPVLTNMVKEYYGGDNI